MTDESTSTDKTAFTSPEERATTAVVTASIQRGRPFKPGQSGNPNGRPPGSRNRLTDVFVSAIADDFAQHGAQAIARVRSSDPAAYLKIVGSFVPRELVIQRECEPAADLGNITLAELEEVIAYLERKKENQKLITRAQNG